VVNQQEKKLKHELDIQEMRVKVKQLALEETCERSAMPKLELVDTELAAATCLLLATN
jgi:hypothetical protein